MRLALSALVLCLTLLTRPARAENRVGLILGGDMASQSFKETYTNGTVDASGNSSTKAGLLFGAFGQWRFTRELHLEVQARLNKKGGKSLPYTFPVYGPGTIDYSLTYLEIPVYAKWRFWTNHPFRPFVFAGPALAFKMSGSSEGHPGLFAQQTGDAGEIKGTDFSFDLGAGGDLKLTQRYTLSLALAYSIGFANITNATNTPGVASTTVKNRGLQIYAGASIPLNI